MKRLIQLLHLSRARRLSLSAAFMAFFLFAIEPAYASGTIQAYVTIPNTDPQPTPSPEESLDPNPTIPALIELDAIKIVNANEMALISVEARKVELAKTPDGARMVAKDLVLNKYGWSASQFSCLNKLWTKESNWRYQARNKTSGAHGIAQALPATKMEVVGTDWRTNPVTQITWGLKYITERYETPCLALRKHNRSRWY
jgi:pyruvate dehydrogenase complex dehydrogenase (E1) component